MVMVDTRHGGCGGLTLSRRRVLVLGSAALLAWPAAARARDAATPPAGRIAFDVVREGTTVGRHVVQIDDCRGGREVRTEIDIVVTLLGVTVYYFRQRTRELWVGDRLSALDGETTEDDASFWVRGRAKADGFEVESRKERKVVPAEIMVATYWRPEICRQRRLLEPKRGRLREQRLLSVRPVTITAGGRETVAEELRIQGILDGACTYDQDGRWLAAWFQKKGRIEYRAVG